MKRKIMRKLQSTRFWLVCIAGMFLLGTFSMFFFQPIDKGSVAVITRGSEVLRRIDLSEVREEYTMLFDHKNGTYNLISVKNDEISVIESSCTDKKCLAHGYISGSETPIICLENKFSIYIESDNEN